MTPTTSCSAAPTIDYDDSVTQTRRRMTASYVEVYETLRRSAERNMQYCIVRVKSFTGTSPTSWNVSSLETADVSDVSDHHAAAAETEEAKSVDPRLRRRLENEPTSPLTPTEMNDADEEPVRTRPRRTIRRERWFNY